jgi:hypothetical protein
MKNLKKKIKKIAYDHWLATLPFMLPFIGIMLLIIYFYFHELMLRSVPFFLVFFALIIIGFLVVWLVKIKKEKKQLELNPEVYLSKDNLIYKKGNNQAHCPVCYETNNQLKRMKKTDYSEKGYLYSSYECFLCHYGENIFLGEEEIDIKDIPF